mmetsp:Transcript_22336/g.89918  ORF Transcript_22336/g.89918 Transcript_22336/m.89918 type:complete len:97 (-) Transcript_22336:186-476(-)
MLANPDGGHVHQAVWVSPTALHRGREAGFENVQHTHMPTGGNSCSSCRKKTTTGEFTTKLPGSPKQDHEMSNVELIACSIFVYFEDFQTQILQVVG